MAMKRKKAAPKRKAAPKKKDWQGRINELAGKPAYKNWLKKK